jgi:hypothetical protein
MSQITEKTDFACRYEHILVKSVKYSAGKALFAENLRVGKKPLEVFKQKSYFQAKYNELQILNVSSNTIGA